MKTIKILLSILALSVLFTSSVSANDKYEEFKQKYNPDVTYCKNEKTLFNIYKSLTIRQYSSEFNSNELNNILNQNPFVPYKICNWQIKPLILSSYNSSKELSKSQAVISEFKSSGASAGSSFYSSTLGSTVYVINSTDMMSGSYEWQKYIIKVNKAGVAKFLVHAGDKANQEFTLIEDKSLNFKAGRYISLVTKNTTVAKIWDTFYITNK